MLSEVLQEMDVLVSDLRPRDEAQHFHSSRKFYNFTSLSADACTRETQLRIPIVHHDA